jgi:hypothetical protein
MNIKMSMKKEMNLIYCHVCHEYMVMTMTLYLYVHEQEYEHENEKWNWFEHWHLMNYKNYMID